MKKFRFLLCVTISTLLYTLSLSGNCQTVPIHAQGLKEELIEVELADGGKQSGVYSTKIGVVKPTKLAVLLPGRPSVVRPTVENGVMTNSRLTSNFLLRARRWLTNQSIAILIVDCYSKSGDECQSFYQASQQRQSDVGKLINEIKNRVPTIEQVWLIGTSMGTISSSFMPTYDPSAYAGAIHTASITEPYLSGSYRELANFNYKKSGIPQFFVHHKNDPCATTTYRGARDISEKFGIPLVTVAGGSGFQGAACDAFTEHGFRGREKEVMEAIAEIIKTGKAAQLEVN